MITWLSFDWNAVKNQKIIFQKNFFRLKNDHKKCSIENLRKKTAEVKPVPEQRKIPKIAEDSIVL